MGPSTLASGEASAAYGDGSNAIGKKSIATGSHAFASAENAIAIGNSTKAQANNTIAIGPDATANQNAEGSLVVGRGAVANATDVTVIGPVAQANGANATAVGRGAAANGTESTALGRGTKADGNQSVALGKGAQATVDSGVALGDSSVADRTARSQNGIVINTSDPSKSTGFNTENSVYAPVRLVDAPEALNLIKNTIKGNKGAVSVGDSGNTRQIINVAAGSADSDAVNVAQLKAVAGAIKHYDVVSPNGDITVTHPDPHDPNKTVWNLNLNPDRVKEITKWKLRNVDKDGNAKAGKTDALVKGDETVTFQDTDTIEVERVGTDGKTLKFSTKKNIKYFSVNSSGGTNEDNKGATVDGAIAIGKNASSTGSNAVSLGLGANASGANNTAIGPGAQAKDVRTTAIGYNANASEASAVGIGYAANATKVRSLAIGQDATTSANNAIALGSSGQHGENKTTASAEHAVAIGSGAIANIINGIALGSQSKTTQDKGQTGFDASQDVEGARTNKYDNLKNNVQNIRTSTLAGLSIGDTGKTRQINHLAAGTADDDAVNVAQLKSVNLAFKGDNNTKGDVRLHDQRLSVVGATNDFITTKANDNKLEIGTKQGTFSTTNGKSSSPKQGLATTTDVATTINQTYWQLQANGSKVGDVNPGDKVNIASGNGITVTPTTEANGVSKITISATVAGIKAGRNVTVETTDGVSTINAIDTNTQASVSKLNNNSPITIDSTGTNSAGAKDYKLDVNVDDKTITKEGGVLKAVTGNLNVNDNGNLNTPQKGSALVNATTLTNVVNNTYWKAAAGGNHADGKTNLPADKVKSSSTVTFNAGKNLTVDHSVANNFTFALNNTVDLTNAGSLTIGNTKVDNGGITITPVAGKSPVSLTANGLDNGNNKIVNVAAGENDNDAVNYKQLKDSISTETVRKADATAGDKNIVEVDPTAEAGKGAKGATYNIAVKESAVKNIAKTAVKVVDGKNTTVTPKDDATDNSKTYAVNVKGDLTDITSITNAAGSGKVEFKDNGVVNVAGNNPIKLDGKTGDITGLTNKTLDGENFAKSGRAATEEQLDIVNQKFNNKVSLGGDTGSTTEKALSNPGGIKFNVKAADGNKVVTTKAEGDNVNINFSGDEAAKVTSLSYKANKGTAKKVTLENGLDFTNGTHTTAEVGDDGVVKFNVETSTVTVPPAQPNTFTGKFEAPEKDGVATIKNVVDVVNNSGWKISQGAESKGIVKAGDEVSFANGDGTTVSVEADATNPNKRIVKVNATLKEAEKGTIVAVTENGTGDNAPKKGQVKANTGDDNKVTTVKNVANMINAATWYAKADNSNEDLAETKNDNGEAVNAGSELTFKAGKNLHVNRTDGVFTFALDSVLKDLTSTTYKNGDKTVTVSADTNGDLHISKPKAGSTTNETVDAKITGVAEGTEDNDAVNYKQLKDSISTETVRKADVTNNDNNIVEVDPVAEAGKGAKGATYNIAVKESAVKNIAKTAVKVVDGKNTTVTPKDDATDNSKTYAVNVKGDLTDITSITNAAGSGKVEFKDNGVVNVAGNNPIKLDGKTGDITGLTNKTLDGENFAKSGRAATEEQLDIVNQKFNNKVSLGGDTGSTTEKALSNPGGIKFNVKAADGNKVVTTKAEGDNVNINFSGDEAAKVTSLSYKANKGTAKKVTLENGLDFTNGTHTTAEVGDDGVVKFNVETSTVTVPPAQPNTFTGKFEAPEKDGVATIKNVVDVVNNSGWKISQGDTQKGIVNPGNEVSFEGGEGTTVTVSNADGNGKRTVTIASTVKPNEKGVIEEVTENGTGTNAPKKGQVKAKSGDDNKVTTVGNVANMINSAKWYAKAENSKDEVTDKTDDSNSDGQAMSAGDKLTLKAGKNLSVNRTNGVFTFALNNTVDLTDKGSLTIGETKVDNGGITITPAAGKSPVTLTANGLDNGNNKIVNVAAGEDDNDAVNYKQLKDTELHIAPTKANGQASGVTYTYDDETKSVTLKYKDGNGKVIENTEAKIDLSGLASKIKDYSFKTNATGSNLVETGTETTVASGKSVNFAASDNLTLKQDVKDGNVTYTYGLKNQVVVGEKGTPGADGKPGKDGIDGSIGVNGKDGSAVAINGKDGSIGLNGENGKNGLTIKGQDGNVGVDGKDGETRLVYVEKAAPTKPGSTDKTHELATLEDGMKYGGDIGEVANVKLNKQVDVKGGVTDKTKLSDNNIGVVSTPNATTGGTELTVKLAKELKGLTSAEFKNGDDKTKTEITHNGITITPVNPVNGKTAVTLTDEGLNNGGNKITHVAEGTDDNDAVNVKQLKTFKDEVGSYGWNLSVNNGKDASKITKDTTVDLNNDDGNIKIAKNGSNVTLSLGPDVGLGKAGKDGKDGSLAVRGKDGASVEISGKDGSIGLTGPKGKDGTPGTSATITVEKGTTTVNDDRDGGKEVTRIVYTDKDKDGNDIKREVATLDDGLKFKGDSKEVINRKLGSQVNITGGADSTKLTENNIGVVYDKATNGLKVKLSKDVNLGDNGTITIGDTVVNKDGLTINGGPSITKGSVNAGNQSVTNVKDGVADNDAVNVKQLKAAKTEVEAGDHIDVTSTTGANGQTIYKVSAKGINDTSAAVKAGSNHVEVTKAANTHKDGSTTVTDYTVDLSKETKEDIKKGVDAHTEVTTKGLTFNADHGTTGVKKLGSKVAVNGDGKNITTTADENGVKVSMKDDIKVNSVTAKEVKVGDVNINENGINAGGKRITNVAPGKDGTDAVNVNQLKYVAGNISNQINNVDKGLRAGIAGALASGGLYHVTTAGKSMVSVGAGTYRGQNALAVGYSRLSDNGKVGVKFTVNSNSQGHAGASASVGYQW